MRPATIKTIQEVQKHGLLEQYRYLGGFIVSIDGTGLFSSGKIHCEECCVKHHRRGEKTFYHQLLSSVIVNPNTNIVLPLLHEAITHQDGNTKNDCEQNAMNVNFLEYWEVDEKGKEKNFSWISNIT